MSSSSEGPASSSRLPEPVRQGQRSNVKGKNKETLVSVGDEDDSLWVDKYEPSSQVRRVLSSACRAPLLIARVRPLHDHAELIQKAGLAVHNRKVQDVRQWLLEAFEGGPSGKLRKHRVSV